ncbi:MAG TPA: adenosylcobinamide-GDP ribazoletransferase [Dermatophilaceae bacterium]|jgi:adenosylcobinamide-GDP ribazoletransferase|nr:adenosylcobinamide-GDP ribazoletransferase [Dermatophilaceae bacterium]
MSDAQSPGRPRHRAAKALRAAAAALTFLTVIPLGRRVALDGDDVANGSPLFPLVGAGIGAVSGTLAWLLGDAGGHRSPVLAAAIGVAAAAALTGFLHMDGLADFADSYGGRTVQDRLRIMRDHSIGSYGASALILTLLIKVAALSTVAGSTQAITIAAAAGALSRTSGAILSMALPYARPEPGRGSLLTTSGNRARSVAVVLFAVAIAVACLRSSLWPATVTAILAAAVMLTLLGYTAQRRLGGVTGDVMGAASELVETTCLALLVVLR